MFGTCQEAPRIIAGMEGRAEAAGPFLVRRFDEQGGGGRGEGKKRGCVFGELPARSRRTARAARRCG